jgi:hypothetical protein
VNRKLFGFKGSQPVPVRLSGTGEKVKRWKMALFSRYEQRKERKQGLRQNFDVKC